jgi:hypothetical protein
MTQDERFDRIDAAIERWGERFEARFQKLEDRLGALERYIHEFRTETIARFERMDEFL